MIEFIFKVGILVTIVLALIAAVTAIPAFASLITTTTGQTESLVSSINGFASILMQYVTPFIGALNLIIPTSVKTALAALIVWKLTKPIALKILAPLEAALEKIIEKA